MCSYVHTCTCPNMVDCTLILARLLASIGYLNSSSRSCASSMQWKYDILYSYCMLNILNPVTRYHTISWTVLATQMMIDSKPSIFPSTMITCRMYFISKNYMDFTSVNQRIDSLSCWMIIFIQCFLQSTQRGTYLTVVILLNQSHKFLYTDEIINTI